MLWQKIHHVYYACCITVNFNGFFVFAKFSGDFRENFRKTKYRENRPIFAFSRKLKKHFRFNPNPNKSISNFRETIPLKEHIVIMLKFSCCYCWTEIFHFHISAKIFASPKIIAFSRKFLYFRQNLAKIS
jgi:hypothetical protein